MEQEPEPINPKQFLWGEVDDDYSWSKCISEEHKLYLNDVGNKVFCGTCKVLWWEQGNRVRADEVPALKLKAYIPPPDDSETDDGDALDSESGGFITQ